MTLSPTVREFVDENRVDARRVVVWINLAPLITRYYHSAPPSAYTAYMILAVVREMSQEEGTG